MFTTEFLKQFIKKPVGMCAYGFQQGMFTIGTIVRVTDDYVTFRSGITLGIAGEPVVKVIDYNIVPYAITSIGVMPDEFELPAGMKNNVLDEVREIVDEIRSIDP